MSESESSEFEPYESYDDFAADLERFTQAQERNYEQELKLGRSSYSKMGPNDETEGKCKIAIQIQPKKSKTINILSDRSEVKKKPIRAPSIEQRLAKFAAVGGSEFRVSLKSPRPQRSSNSESDFGGETGEAFAKQRFRSSADNFKVTQNKDENANEILRSQSLTSAVIGKSTQGRIAAHKSHEINQIDHTKDEMRIKDGTKEAVKLSLRRPGMQPDEPGQFPLRRKSSQAKTQISPVSSFQGPQQAPSRLGVADRKSTAKQTQWAEQDTDQPKQQKNSAAIREPGKSLSHHIIKQGDFKSFASSRSKSTPSSNQPSKSNSLPSSFTSGKFTTISASQREKPQQACRGGIFHSSKLQGFKSEDSDRYQINPQLSTTSKRIDSNSWKSQQQSQTIKLKPSSSLTRVVEKNNNIVWITTTDSATCSSDEDPFIETDSSTTTSCSVIDERRRRRLVKRTKKRGQANRKSQLSQFIGREVSAIESQTSDDGASRASPSVNESIEDVISPDEDIAEISPKASYQRARQIFEKQTSVPEPNSLHKSVPKVQKTGYETATVVTETGLKSINTPASSLPSKNPEMASFHSSLVSLTSMDLETRNLSEGLRRERKGPGSTFSGLAKVSKITIPSLQMRNLNPPGKYRHNSDTESYAGQSKILSDPFILGRSRFRDNNQGFSDGEHELTSRLEKNEEFANEMEADSNFDLGRRCYTLPRNIGRKKMKENPFQLNFKGKSKGKDYLDLQSNSQSSMDEDANSKVLSFLSAKDTASSNIQSRSTSCIGNEGSNLQNGTPNEGFITADSQSGTESSSTITNFSISTNIPTISSEQEKLTKNIDIINGDTAREAVAIASPIPSSQPSSPYYQDLIAPPDNFKDFPNYKQLMMERELAVTGSNKMESDLIFNPELLAESLKNNNISKENNAQVELTRGRQVIYHEKQEDHDRGESPRRRPSYLKAQFTDNLFWPESPGKDLVAKGDDGKPSFDMPKMPEEDEQSFVNSPSSPSDDKDTLGQKKKRSRPRIPSSLEPIKSIDEDLLLATSISSETKSSGI